VQATDEYIAVRNARLVLVDDAEIRATMTASWLIQMGWEEVYVLAGGVGSGGLAGGPHQPEIPGWKSPSGVSPETVKAWCDAGRPVSLIDLSASRGYSDAHIPGALWGVRSRLSADLSRIGPAERIVLTSEDGILAQLAVAEVRAFLPEVPVAAIRGGNRGWVAAGYPMESGMTAPVCTVQDVWFKPYERPDAQEAAMQAYLEWEVALVDQIGADGTVRFRRF